MNETLKKIYSVNLLRTIDVHFAGHICESFDCRGDELLFALIFNSAAMGNTCLVPSDIRSTEIYKRFSDEVDSAISSQTITRLINKKVLAKAPCTDAPFILDGTRIYMKSFYSDEKTVAGYIQKKASEQTPADQRKLYTLLDKYFDTETMQKAAAMNAALNTFSVISGGPGTGKTSTVFKLLAILLELSDTPLSIAVCAPTGKAASRLSESLSEKKAEYSTESFIGLIPEKAHTIHRLLGMRGDTKKPEFGGENKLRHDIVVVDEASMVDISLMSKLLTALKPDCRLILLGDKDQLASVQPGAVLGDICTMADVDYFTSERAGLLSRVSGKDFKISADKISDITVMLDKSYRYDDQKGIGLLAKAAAAGDSDTAMQVLRNDATGKAEFIEMDAGFENEISKYIIDHYKNYSAAETPEQSLKLFNKMRILTPHRKTTGGTDHINSTALSTLFKAGLRDSTQQFFHGMPLMIVENDYSLNLFNGETCIVLGQEDKKAYFSSDYGLRMLSPSRIPAHVPVFAMTVHKSQGSEFEHVVFVLPETESRVLTRELFYTAVTRAKNRLTVISTEKAVRDCLSSKTARNSGLFS